eukprot:TRINITY_DN7686_c0_g1_i25.p2 TRINITY_DN7686_c0_g1~~TRINITY_DN7686_c0_g1_i25.p2  ORF type:complete len:131 (+),score=12.35 TRINITY_DN7686_c0_g1_i25:389-781(+)
MHDDSYPGSYVITNLVAWNRFLAEKKDDVPFNTKAMEIYNGYKLRDEYLKHLEKVSEPTPWVKWKEYQQNKSDISSKLKARPSVQQRVPATPLILLILNTPIQHAKPLVLNTPIQQVPLILGTLSHPNGI